MTLVEIAGVVACECPAHARVVLFDPQRRRKLYVRVHTQAGQVLLAELAGVPSQSAALVDLLRDALRAAGASFEAVTLRFENNDLCASVRLCGPQGRREIDTEPCEALLAACRMGAELFVDERTIEPPPRDQVPEAYRQAVETIDFSGLGED